jgi:hypothetical protein
MIDFLAKAPAGSRLVFTYCPKDFIDGKVIFGQEHLYKEMLLKEKSWLFDIGPEDVADFIVKYSWVFWSTSATRSLPNRT